MFVDGIYEVGLGLYATFTGGVEIVNIWPVIDLIARSIQQCNRKEARFNARPNTLVYRKTIDQNKLAGGKEVRITDVQWYCV